MLYQSWKSCSQSCVEVEPRKEKTAVELGSSHATATTVPVFCALMVTEPGAIVLGPFCNHKNMLMYKSIHQCTVSTFSMHGRRVLQCAHHSLGSWQPACNNVPAAAVCRALELWDQVAGSADKHGWPQQQRWWR